MIPSDAEPSHAHEAAHARIGEVIGGRWRLDAVLGLGGTSAVYAATDGGGVRAAIKVVPFSAAGGERARARLRREARAANQLAALGGVAVLEDGVEGDALFLVMDLLDGETAAARARAAGGALAIEEALRIGEGVLATLSESHARGIVHRDVKPDNVFLTRDGGIRVLDFGLAQLAEPLEGADLTRSGATLGTPAFMAPEQARGKTRELGARTDVWGVGATLFTLLTGRFVHDGETTGEMLFLAGSHPAPSVTTLRPELPSRYAEVIDRALAFDAAARFEDAGAMLEALRAAGRALESGDVHGHAAPGCQTTIEEPVRVPPSAPTPRRRHASRTAIGAATLAFIALSTSVAAWAARGSRATSERRSDVVTFAPSVAMPAVNASRSEQLSIDPVAPDTPSGARASVPVHSHRPPHHTSEPPPPAIAPTPPAAPAPVDPPPPTVAERAPDDDLLDRRK